MNESLEQLPLDARLRKVVADDARRWAAVKHPPPRILWHYTGTAGLEGIVSSGKFWASHVRYLNDASEFDYGRALIEEVLNQQGEKNPALAEMMRRDAGFGNPIEHGPEPFVVCFCEDGDLLSQWRGYGAGGGAHSLGLRTEAVVPLLPRQHTELRQVVYDRSTQLDLVNATVSAWLEAIEPDLVENSNPPIPLEAIFALRVALLEHHLCFKNPAFAEEKEWRLIRLVDVDAEVDAQRRRRDSETLAAELEWPERLNEMDARIEASFPPDDRAEGIDVKTRPSPLGFVPYIDMDLRALHSPYRGLPLMAVMLGPTAHPALAARSLKLFLATHGYAWPHTSVRVSEVPLRA